MREIKGDLIADYAWLSKGRKYWNLWAGNPFCITKYQIKLENHDRDFVVNLAKRGQANEKIRFAKDFPEVEWSTTPLPTPTSKENV